MIHAFLLFFLILVSCVTANKTYICGDRACLDKKEFKEYFAENLILEIETKKSKKYSNVDLVKLNKTTQDTKVNSEIETKLDSKMSKKEKRALLKNEKIKLKEERKTRAIIEKYKANEKKKLEKLKKNNKKNLNNLETSVVIKKEPIIEKTVNNPKLKTVKKKLDIVSNEKTIKTDKSEKNISICNQIKDCDIDKITELLIKKNKDKGFPDITIK